MDDFKIRVGAELDKNAGKEIQNGLNKVKPQPIEVPFQIDLKNSNEIKKEMNRMVKELTQGKGSLVDFKIDTSTVFDKDLGRRIERLQGVTLKYKNSVGEVVSELYKMRQIGTTIGDDGQEQAIMGWAKATSNYSQSIESATKKQTEFIMKQKELTEQMKLLQIQAEKSGVTLNNENISGFNNASINENTKEMAHYLSLAKIEFSQLNALMEKELPISGLENMKKNIGTMPIDIQNVETSFKRLINQPEELMVRIEQLSSSFNQLNSFSGDEVEKVKYYNLLKNEISNTTKEVNALIKAQQQEVTESQKNQFFNQISIYLKDNTKLTAEFRNKLIDIQGRIKDVDKTQLNQLKGEFREITSEVNALGLSGKNIFDKLKGDIGNFLTFVTAGGGVMGVIKSTREIISTVKELDKSLVDLQQSTGFSLEKTKELLNTYIDLGKELGATGTEVSNAAGQWLRQGKSIAETNELIRASIILSKVGQIDSAQATEYLTSAMKGYKLEASEVLGVVDKLSAIDLSSATDVSGLAEGMSQVANMADLAGVSMDKLLSYLAVVGEVTQKSMSSIGQSFQTMFARMGNIKIGKFIDDETGESLNDVEKVLNKLNIQLRDSKDSFRNFGDVLDDVGRRWNEFSDVEKNAIGVAIAGTRQRENFTVLMSNFSKTLDYTEISVNSTGVALEKFSAYESSVEASTKKLQSSLQSLAKNTLDSGVIKSFLNLSNSLITIIDKVGLFNIALLTTAGIVGGKGLLILFPKLATGIANIAASFGLATVTAEGAAGAAGILGATLSTMLPVLVGVVLVKAFSALNVTLEEHRKNIETLSGEYQTIQSELQSLQDELDNTGKKIDELNKKDTLTLIEQGELQSLKETNKELENRITLLQEEAKLKAQSVNKEIEATFKKDFKNKREYGKYEYDEFGVVVWTEDPKDEETHFREKIEEAKKLIALGDKRTAQQQTELDNIKKYTTEVGNRIAKDIEGYVVYDEATEKQKQYWEELIDLSAKVANPSKWKQNAFDEIYNSDKFKNYKKELDELAQKGKLSPEILYYNKQYEELLRETGLTASEAANHINAINKATEETSNQISRIPTETFEALNDALDKLESKSRDTVSSVGELNQVLYDQAKGEKLTAKEAYNLITKYPQLSSALEKTTDGYKINQEAIDAVRESMISQENANATAQLNMTRDTLNGVKDRLEAYGIEIEAITDLKTAMGEQDKLSLNKLYGTMDGWGFDDTTKRITTPTGSFIAISQGEYDGIKAAYEEQKSIYDTIGKMGNLKERINGLSNNLLSDPKYGVTEDKGKKTDPIKEAFDLGINGIAGKNDLDHQLAMGKIKLEDYYKGVEAINKATYGKHKDTHLENYRQYLAEVHNGRKKLEQDSVKAIFDDLKFDYDMGYKTEAEYYKLLEEYNEKYNKNDKDRQSDYRSNLVTINKWKVEQSKVIETIDWASISIKNLQDAVETAQNKLDNTDGYQAQIDAINELVKAQEALKAGYQSSAALYKSQYDNITGIDSYKTMIESGATFELLDIVDEKLRENISAAIDYFNKWRDSLSKIDSTTKSISNNYEQINSILDGAIKDIESIQSRLANSIKKENQELYDDRVKQLRRIRDLDVKYHNDRIELLQEEIKRIQGNTIPDKLGKLSGLQDQYKAWLSDDSTLGKAKQKELLDQISELNKEIQIDKLEEEIKSERDLIESINEKFDKAIDEDSENFDIWLKTHKDNMSDQKAYDRANALLLSGNQKEIANLITKFDPVYSGIATLMGETAGGIIAKAVTNALEALGILKNSGTWSSSSGSFNYGSVPVSGVNYSEYGDVLDNKALSVLKSGGQGQDTTGLSKLNQYVVGQGYDVLTKTEMVELAKALGVSGINSTADVGTDAESKYNKERLLDALINKGYITQYAIGGKTLEDGLAYLHSDERVLTPQQTEAFDKLVYDYIPNIFEKYTKNNAYSSAVTNNNNVVTFNRELVKVDKIVNYTPFDVQNNQDNLNRMFVKTLKDSGIKTKL